MEEPDISPLERARRELYGQEHGQQRRVHDVTFKAPGAPEHWQHEEAMTVPQMQLPRKKMPASMLFLLGSLAFFVVAGLAAAVVLFLGGRSVSADNVEILIEGPTTIEGGEAVSLLVTLKNNNPVAVTDGTFTVDFPDGTSLADDPTEPLQFFTEEVPEIAPGASVRKTVRASFFGAENQRVMVPMTFEYATADSNAVFVKKKQYDLVLGTSPVSVSVASLSETASGQELTFSVIVRSNASTPLENIALQATYPTGFQYVSSTPQPVAGATFLVGRLMPGEEKRVSLTGRLVGVDCDVRAFHFTAGTLLAAGAPDLRVPAFTTQSKEVTIARPFLSTEVALNRSQAQEIVLPAGAAVEGALSWKNDLPSTVTDGQITIALSGSALDPSSVIAGGGFYRSSDRSIIFSSEYTPGLARLEPGAIGSGTFSFSPKTGAALTELRNPFIELSVSVSGRRVGAGSVPETVTSTLTRTVRLATDLRLASRVVRTVGPFVNIGPWPPRADEETTYTVMLFAGNTVNSVANASARMVLPSYVRFTGQVSQGSTVTYNQTTREVTWNVGDLAAGAAREAAFQVALLPSISQKGTSPVLVSEGVLVGFDRFVQQQVEHRVAPLSTQATTDPAYTLNTSSVQ